MERSGNAVRCSAYMLLDNISTRTKSNRCASAIWMAELFVRTPLPNLLKANALKNGHDFLWF